MKWIFLGATMALVLTCGAADAVVSGVVIDIKPPAITRRTFDPNNPPTEMPQLKPPEVGTCVYSFGCTTEMEIRGSLIRATHVTGIQVSAQLDITLWTPIDGAAKILAHEEGHRAICEIYYRSAESIARRLAEREIGANLKRSVRDKDGAELELKKIQDRLIAAFLRQTATRCEVAQASFDAVTDHSKNEVSESEAIAQAVAEEKAAYASTAAAKLDMAPVDSNVATRREPTRPVR